jgi:hypothetical protein
MTLEHSIHDIHDVRLCASIALSRPFLVCARKDALIGPRVCGQRPPGRRGRGRRRRHPGGRTARGLVTFPRVLDLLPVL